jgi:NADH:ubiquinone oxidoreductase subunit E
MNAAAKRTAQEIIRILSRAFAEQGWIPADKVKK